MYRLRRDLNHSKIVRKPKEENGTNPSISVEQATPPASRQLTPMPSMASGLNMIIDSRDRDDDINAEKKRTEGSGNRFLVTPLNNQNEARGEPDPDSSSDDDVASYTPSPVTKLAKKRQHKRSPLM